MQFRTNGVLGRLLILSAFAALAACIGDNDDGVLSGVEVAPPPAVPPQDNVNIPNPTLFVFDNAPSGPATS